MSTRDLRSKVRSDWPYRTHVGFAIAPLPADGEETETLTVRRVDAESFDRAMVGARSARSGRRNLRRLHRQLAEEVAPGYVVCGPGERPLLACLRIPGGMKTRKTIRQAIGDFVPQVAEREQVLASLWIAPGSSPTELANAITALVHLDPPGHLSRTVVFLPYPIGSATLSALGAAGAQRYIYCVRQRRLPAFWRNRHDWIGPAQIGSSTRPGPQHVRPTESLQPHLQPEENMK